MTRLAALWSSTLRPFATRVLRPLGIVTPLGWAVLATGAAAAAAGLPLGWGELIAIAVGLAVVFAIAVPFVLGRTRYAVAVELASERVVVGEPAVGRLVIENSAGRTTPANRVELPVGSARAEFRVPRLGPSQQHDELFTIPTQRRAVLTLGPVTSVRTDPVGVLRRTVEWTEPTDLYVHPRTVSLTADLTGLVRDLEGLPTRDLADDDVSFHALREYAPGDDLRHVHWRSTARTGTLMIRQFEQTRRSHLVVVLSTRAEDYADADEFELAVSIVASVAVSAAREEKAVTVLTQEGALSAQTPTRLMDSLSAVELKEGVATLDALARAVAQEARNASVVVLVAGTPLAPAEVRSASLHLPVTATTFALRVALGDALSRRQIGEVPVVTVPALDSLRVALRAVTA